MTTIFVSHSTKNDADKATLVAVIQALEVAGYTVETDQKLDDDGACLFDDALARKMFSSDGAVILFSDAANLSRYVIKEAIILDALKTHENDFSLICVSLNEVTPEVLNDLLKEVSLLGKRHWTYARDYPDGQLPGAIVGFFQKHLPASLHPETTLKDWVKRQVMGCHRDELWAAAWAALGLNLDRSKIQNDKCTPANVFANALYNATTLGKAARALDCLDASHNAPGTVPKTNILLSVAIKFFPDEHRAFISKAIRTNRSTPLKTQHSRIADILTRSSFSTPPSSQWFQIMLTESLLQGGDFIQLAMSELKKLFHLNPDAKEEDVHEVLDLFFEDNRMEKVILYFPCQDDSLATLESLFNGYPDMLHLCPYRCNAPQALESGLNAIEERKINILLTTDPNYAIPLGVSVR